VTDKSFQKDMDWAADLEMLASGLAAGLAQAEAIQLVSQRGSPTWSLAFRAVAQKYVQLSNLSVALAESKNRVADFRFDLLAELLIANQQLGGGGLLTTLSQDAQEARLRATSNEDSMSRIRSVVSIAKLGVSSPWIMFILLATREENRQAYFSSTGWAVLAFGFALTLFAWLIIKRTARMPAVARGLAS